MSYNQALIMARPAAPRNYLTFKHLQKTLDTYHKS